jgi:hypothetical protein
MINKVYFVVPYFGRLPNYFQLWLDSCGYNTNFNWLFLTDCCLENYTIPNNVRVIYTDIDSLKMVYQSNFDFEILLNTPYKLCDYRPLNWKILDYYKIEYDFWGYCDIDLIFGNLSSFLSGNRLEKYDRIYSEGHLSIMRNSLEVKNTYKLPGGFYYKDVFKNGENLGFDEHHGVNKKWKNNNLKYYFNKKEIIDIDPQIKKFSFTYLSLNKKNQFFIFENKSIYRAVIVKDKVVIKDEFAYMHFQKRKMKLNSISSLVGKVIISDKGFSKYPLKISELKNIISFDSKLSFYSLKKIKRLLRFIKNNYIYGI